MEYKDEQIITWKREMKSHLHKDIKNEAVYIQDQLTWFEPMLLFEKVSVYLPKDFIDMPQLIKEIKYPSVKRPELIKTNVETNVNFGFSLLNELVEPEQVKELAEQIKLTIKKANPAISFYRLETILTEQGRAVSLFDFKSYGVDEHIYNLMCIFPLSFGTLQGIFNCRERDYDQWCDVAWQVFLTLAENKISGG